MTEPVEGMPRLWPASELKPAAQPRWLARNRMPRRSVSLLIGDEGIGKSLCGFSSSRLSRRESLCQRWAFLHGNRPQSF